MIKEFECDKTPACHKFEQRFGNYEQYCGAFSLGRVVCPVCRQVPKPVASHTSPPQFKGSGFYATDYKGT